MTAGFAIALLLGTAGPLGVEDWTQFLGPAGKAVAPDGEYPLEWSKTRNVRWRVELPGPANSSPIVSAGRVFVTTARQEGRQRTLHCFDRQTGSELWTQSVEVPEREPTHKTNPYSASTPVADGDHVYIWHGSGGVFCYDYAGKLVWSADLGKFIHIWGYGSSPILFEDKLYINCGPGERSFLIALDKATGKTVWKVDEPGGNSGEPVDGKRGTWIGSWSTPVLAVVNDRPQLLVSFPHHVKAFEPRTGELLWECDGLGNLVYTSVVVSGDYGIAMSGFHGPAIGFQFVQHDDKPSAKLLWREEKRMPQRIGSGVIVDDSLYMANADNGTVQCIDVATGKERWRERMPKPAACWGSIVRVQDRLHVTNQNGHTIVFRPNREKFEILAVNSLDEHTNSTPAFTDGEIFLRTYDALYCIANEK